jgi:hypothetical protein
VNRRSILNISAMITLGLAVVPGGAVAQQKSLKDQLVGTWTLVSRDFTLANGTKRQLAGANVKGILIFDTGGRYAEVIGRSDRPKFKSPTQPTTEELAAATQDYYGANFGTWSASEADKTLTRRFDSALRPNNEGTDVKETVSLAGGELKLSRIIPANGARIEDVWRVR